MSTSFMISIPTSQPELRDEIEQELAAYANVNLAPGKIDLNEIKLIVEIIAGVAATGAAASTVALNTAKIVEFLLMLKDRYEKEKKPSGIRIAVPGQKDIPLDSVDEAILKRMMGLGK